MRRSKYRKQVRWNYTGRLSPTGSKVRAARLGGKEAISAAARGPVAQEIAVISEAEQASPIAVVSGPAEARAIAVVSGAAGAIEVVSGWRSHRQPQPRQQLFKSWRVWWLQR